MQNLDRYLQETQQSNTHNVATLLVSLYLVVLAFFILLNSISERDTKKIQKAVTSLSSVFSNQSGNSDLQMETPALFDFNFVVSSYFDQIETVVESAFQIKDLGIKKSGNSMSISLPINQFYYPEEQGLKKAQRDFLDQVAEILKEEQKGVRAYLDFSIDSFSFIGSADNNINQQDIARTSLVINYLLEQGVPKELISGGLRFNDQKNITIEFIILEAGNITGVKDAK